MIRISFKITFRQQSTRDISHSNLFSLARLEPTRSGRASIDSSELKTSGRPGVCLSNVIVGASANLSTSRLLVLKRAQRGRIKLEIINEVKSPPAGRVRRVGREGGGGLKATCNRVITFSPSRIVRYARTGKRRFRRRRKRSLSSFFLTAESLSLPSHRKCIARRRERSTRRDQS